MNAESLILKKILLAISKLPFVRLFRNNVGLGFQGTIVEETPLYIVLKNYRRIKFGLCNGSGDLIGWTKIKVTPEMVGREMAVFTSLETKTLTGKAEEDQKNWRDQIKKSGGISGIVRTPDESLKLLNGGL